MNKQKATMILTCLLGKPIRKLPKELKVSASAAASDLYKTLAQKSGLSIHRLRVTKGSDGSVVPNGSEKIHSTGLRSQSIIYVKDLGKWETPIWSLLATTTADLLLLNFRPPAGMANGLHY
jgi:hypothetical protein